MRIKYLVVPLLCLSVSLSAACTPKDTPQSNGQTEQTDGEEQTSELSEPSQETKETAAQEKNKPLFLQIPAPSLSNNILEEQTEPEIGIYLPPDYHTSQKEYPVIYFLPGFQDGHFSYINSFAKSMNTLIGEQKVTEMIVVTINGNNKLGGSFYTNSPVTGNWKDFVAKDVVTYIDDNYRTIKNADARGIAGHSMGGSGAISIAMHTEGVFGCVYSMSPGIFNEEGLSKSLVNFKLIDQLISEYDGLDQEAARAAYLKYILSLSWPENFSFAYGSAFAGNTTTKAPYIQLPEKDGDGEYIHDDIWKLYESGFGNIPERLDLYKDNLLNLKGFVVEYGTHDEFTWIPEGCEYFSEKLKEQNIPHQLIPYDGNHESKVFSRIKEEVLPFFSEIFDEQ